MNNDQGACLAPNKNALDPIEPHRRGLPTTNISKDTQAESDFGTRGLGLRPNCPWREGGVEEAVVKRGGHHSGVINFGTAYNDRET